MQVDQAGSRQLLVAGENLGQNQQASGDVRNKARENGKDFEGAKTLESLWRAHFGELLRIYA